ncbi:hypothetical protein PUG81_27580 [Erwiniaceae bacterium L1_54_6]|nr:hypothetical protein [Erwiniaceae bacterium L1_54_6]
MKSEYGQWIQSITLTDILLLSVLSLVVVTLWWCVIAHYRSLCRRQKSAEAMQTGDAAFWRARCQSERAHIITEIVMAMVVTAAVCCVLTVLIPLY